MEHLLINPLTIWLIWFYRSRLIFLKNRKKHLKIGIMTRLDNVILGVYNTFYSNITIWNSTIGDYVYIADRTKISNTTIGKFCSIGPDVKIGLGMHPAGYISTFPAFFSTAKQCQTTFADKNYFNEIGRNEIGNDVWIGANVIILSNVKIGDGAIVGAGSVVTKDVEPYSIVGGIPAKPIRKRFADAQIKQLIDYKWWDRSIDWIKNNYSLFHKPENFFEVINQTSSF